jgi:hypothetical protein
MVDPNRTKAVLDVGRSAAANKWNYLVSHYPDKLRQ